MKFFMELCVILLLSIFHAARAFEDPSSLTIKRNKTSGDVQCGQKADIAFIVDTSNSNMDAARDSKKFLKQFVASYSFNIPNQVRVAIAQIDAQFSHQFRLKNNAAIKPGDTKPLLEAISNVQCCTVGSKVGLALDKLSNTFSSKAGDRLMVQNYAVFLMDGGISDSKHYPIEKLAQTVRQQGIKIIVIHSNSVLKDKHDMNINLMLSGPEFKLKLSSPTLAEDLAALMGIVPCTTTSAVKTTQPPKPTTTTPQPVVKITLPPKPTTTTQKPVATTTQSPKPPTTTTPKSCPVVAPLPGDECADRYSSCAALGERVCTSLTSWARFHCPVYCKLCTDTTVCTNVIADCRIFGDTICSAAPLSQWVDNHCRKYCNRC